MNAAFTTRLKHEAQNDLDSLDYSRRLDVEKTFSVVLLAATFVDWNKGLSLIPESTSEVATACQNAIVGKFEEDIETEKDDGEKESRKMWKK
ncbi:unnamed protein product [Peronospora effusa]|nr:unnamed protein product [Peronospora effusa]